jgi:hypothetical protein
MYQEIEPGKKVPFSKIFLDPNNPRIASEDRPGYQDPKKIFNDEIQAELDTKIFESHEVDELETSVVSQGWVPIDSIIVWEHPKEKEHYVVVEGNRRTVTLRRIRKRCNKEKNKLSRMDSNGSKYDKRELEAQRDLVVRLQNVIAQTDSLFVHVFKASTPEELEEKLPRLLGVRHVTHASNWNPFATNLYMLMLYRVRFAEKFGENENLRLEQELIEKVGDMLSAGHTITRRNIQAASAFSHFRRNYLDKLSEGDTFTPKDQNYFQELLKNKYAREQFGFDVKDLYLSDEMEEVLFKWAFRNPRYQKEEGKVNILRIAEDFRLWATMANYDNQKGTAFATELDVESPDTAKKMDILEAEYMSHKARISAVDNIDSLLNAFKKMEVETLMSQAAHLRPILEELNEHTKKYLKMVDAALENNSEK